MRWEVANLTERKNPHAPINDVKEFVRLSDNSIEMVISLVQWGGKHLPIFSRSGTYNYLHRNMLLLHHPQVPTCSCPTSPYFDSSNRTNLT